MNKEILAELSDQLLEARVLLDIVYQKLSKESQSKQTALLFGLNYPETEHALNGCVNDVVLMSSKLRSKFKYGDKDIQLRTDSDLINSDVLDHLKHTVIKLSSGDKLFFHYSGHGTQTQDLNKDERDGKDEAIYTHHGTVADDQIAEVLSLIPQGVKVFLIFDCCNSGTIADLPYMYKNSVLTIQNSQKKFAADIITLSGCKDDQTSMDAWNRERNGYYGALTSSIIEIVDSENVLNLTWKGLIKRVKSKLRQKGYTQIPQLCASRRELFKEKVWW